MKYFTISLQKIILYYLYGALAIPIIIKMIMGKLDDVSLHPGILIHLLILFLLISNFLSKKIKKNKLSYMVLGFTIAFIFTFFIVELIQFNTVSPMATIQYSLKIYLMLFLSYYIYVNVDYYLKYFDKIMIFNSTVFLMNVILGNYFQIGWETYSRVLEDSHRGYLAGNDSSMLSFVVFGYALFSLSRLKGQKTKLILFILIICSLYSMYIIATKSIFVAAILLLLYSIYSGLNFKKVLVVLVFIFSILGVGLTSKSIQDRMFKNYLTQIEKSEEMAQNDIALPESLEFLKYISPGRIIVAISLIYQQTGEILNLVIGYGVAGIYIAFGRPPMMDIFAIIGYYGLLGWILFYLPQLLLAFTIIFKKKLNIYTALYFAVFLYGSIGGFLYGFTTISVFYAMFMAFSFHSIKFKKEQIK